MAIDQDVTMPKKILIVDDDEDFLELFCERFRDLGAKDVVSAINGEEAFTKLRDDPNITVLICDCMMPELDGLTLKEKINLEMPERQLLTIIVSGYGTESLRDLASSLGIQKWIDKPVEDPTVLNILEESRSYLDP